MKTKIFAVLGILALITALLPTAVIAAPPPPDYKPVDVGPELRTWGATLDRIQGVDALTPAEINAKEAEAMAALAGTPYQECATDAKIWLSLDNFNGSYFLTTYYLVSETAGSELWVQEDLSWDAVDDPRATPEISCEQAEYLLSEFDNNMYPTEISYFGTPDFHDGTTGILPGLLGLPADYYADPAGRQVVLVSNIRDESYYDYTFPNYIAGFFTTAFETYFDRNVMSIDAYDWANRVGPDGTRPHLYEGVFAHEYQHLLHSDYDSDEVNFVNEGLSQFAEFLTGYAEGNDAYGTFEALPENSLTAWGDQGDREIVADYGIAFLWYMYMWENYGDAFIQDHFLNPDNDISGINSSLSNIGSSDVFSDIFHDFAAATVVDSGDYIFENHDVNLDLGTKGNPNPDAYASPGAPPWGSDYYILGGYESIANFQFNGFQFNPLAWTSDGDVLWGGSGDLVDNFAIFETVGGGTLTFDTMFDIEFAWDYGFVQVSTDDGATWTSLSNADTCSDLASGADPKVVANVPGFTGVSGFGCNDPYAAATYPTAEWINTSFDLSAYAGQDILVAFRYVTDWAFNEPGWYIDNVMVDGVEISDGSSTDAFMGINEVLGISNEFTVILIGERNRRGMSEYEVQTILTDGYASDWTSVREMFNNYRTLYMLVIYDAPEGVTSYADYTFEISHKGGKHLK